MLQNARVTAFTVSELLKENQQGGGSVKLPPPPPRSSRLGLKMIKNDFYFILKALFVLKIFKLLS